MRERRGRDGGTTFVEVLVSIVLLGTVVGGTLTALRSTIVSSEVDEGQSKAQAWLRAAEDALYGQPYVQCTAPVGENARAAYLTAIKAVSPPDGWSTDDISISSVRFWSKADGQETWSNNCAIGGASSQSMNQLVEILVVSPDDTVGKRIQVIKHAAT